MKIIIAPHPTICGQNINYCTFSPSAPCINNFKMSIMLPAPLPATPLRLNYTRSCLNPIQKLDLVAYCPYYETKKGSIITRNSIINLLVFLGSKTFPDIKEHVGGIAYLMLCNIVKNRDRINTK